MPTWCSRSRPHSKTSSCPAKKRPRESGANILYIQRDYSGNQQRVIVISRVPPLSDGTVLISLLFSQLSATGGWETKTTGPGPT
jgi:hypothetical protein